jgi:hypothetical protein
MIENKQDSRRFITGVKYVLPENISSETIGNDVVCTLNPGIEWKSIYFTPGTADLNDSSSKDGMGIKYSYNFQMDVPGGGKDLNKELDSICSRPIVLLIEYSDGESLYCGGKNRKLRLQRNRKMGSVSESQVSFEYWYREPFVPLKKQ